MPEDRWPCRLTSIFGAATVVLPSVFGELSGNTPAACGLGRWKRTVCPRLASWPGWFPALVAAVLVVVSGPLGCATASAHAVPRTYDTVTHTYNGTAPSSAPHAPAADRRSSPGGPDLGTWVNPAVCCSAAVAAKTVDDIPAVHWGQQSKHFPGHPNYMSGKSTLTANPEALVQRAGTGTPVGSVPRGQPGFKERIDFGDNIGTWISRDGSISKPTSIGVLHYRADGSVHIVPGRPQ